MSSKKKIVIGIIVLIVVIIGVLIFNLVKSIEADKKIVEENMVTINENYDIFQKYIEQFNQKSELLQKEMGKELYYTSLSSKSTKIVKMLKELDEVVAKIMEINNILEDKCEIYYKDAEVNQKCQSFNVTVENVVTVYKGAIENYNKVVTSYNDWIKKQGNSTYKNLSPYQSKVIK